MPTNNLLLMIITGNYLSVSMPNRDGGLSWGHVAQNEVGACLQALCSKLQTHKAKLLVTARTDDVLAACLVVLHFHPTGGTNSDRGTRSDPTNLRKCDGLAGLKKLQVVVGAAFVVTAVGAWGLAFPWPQALPAEFVCSLLVNCADGAVHIKVGQILSLHICLAPGTLLGRRRSR